MFLRNFAEWERAKAISTIYIGGSGTVANNVLTTFENTAGNLGSSKYLVGVNATYNFFDYDTWGVRVNRAWNLFQNLSCLVGTGTTEVSESDYCLANDVTSSFVTTVSNFNAGVTDDGHFFVVATWNGTNNTANDITLTEIGLVKVFNMYHLANVATSGIGNTGEYNILLARHILEEPVTIGAGNTGTITVKIEMF